MKRIVIGVAFLALLAWMVWLVWLRPAPSSEEEPGVETVVAVRVGRISRTTLRRAVTAYGLVEPQPPGRHLAASARVAPSAPGVVRGILCAEGQQVAEGALLFQLDSRAADAAAEKARVAAEFAEKTYERQQKLIAVDGTSQKQLQEAREALDAARADLNAARTQQALLRVTAPMAGTVARIAVKPGEAVDLGTTMAELVDLDRLVVSAGVPSSELASLKVGQGAEVITGAASAPVAASLIFVGAEVDPKTGTAPVRVSLPARSDLRPGTAVTLRIVTEEHRDCLAAPAGSVVKNAAGETVLALVSGDRAVQRPVKTGLRDGDLIEVSGDGLQAGAAVVTEGAYGLPPETRVRIVGD